MQQSQFKQQSQNSLQGQTISIDAEQARTQPKTEDAHVAQTRTKKKNSGKRHFNRKVGRWYLGETLEKSCDGYSWITKGYDCHGGRNVSLKFTSKSSGKLNWSDNSKMKQITNEIETLHQVKHHNVIQLLAYNVNAKYHQKDGTVIPTVLLVYEYLAGGRLFDMLHYTHRLTEDIARSYFNQLINGLTAYHNAGICHKDICPQNLLLDSNFVLKIAHCGVDKMFDKDIDPNVKYTFSDGKRCYQAPEILDTKQKGYTFECDIFSCGAILFILLAGYPPFEAATPKCRWYAPLVSSNARTFWKQHRGCGIPSAAKDLITRMIWYDKKKRITIAGINKHKWYNGKRLSYSQIKQELKKLHRKMQVETRSRHDSSSGERSLAPYIHCHIPSDFELSLRCDNKYAVIFDNGEILSPSEIESRKLNHVDHEEKNNYNQDEKLQEIDPEDVHVVNVMETECTEEEDSGADIPLYMFEDRLLFFNGDTIDNCAEIWKARLKSMSNKVDIKFNCTGIMTQKFLNVEKEELYCHNIVSTLVKMYSEYNTKWKKIMETGDTIIDIEYSTKKSAYIAPDFPESEIIGFRDIFTQRPPKLIIGDMINTIIQRLGGVVYSITKECGIDAKMATHNFPEPVTFTIQIYFLKKYHTYVVRFHFISGDLLNFAKVVRALVLECGYLLTGLSNEEYEIVEQSQQDDEKNGC